MGGFSASASQRHADLHVVMICAVVGTALLVLGFAAGAYTSPAPRLRCALNVAER